jgi:hypothetical protein
LAEIYAGRNNHLNGKSGKHWKIPFISGGIGRNTAVSAGLQANRKTPSKQEPVLVGNCIRDGIDGGQVSSWKILLFS